jgi:autotransporter-associated beta strand protein
LGLTGLAGQTITVQGVVYSGQGVWNTDGSGNWIDNAKWTAAGGVPGIDGALSVYDSAFFGNALASVPATVNLNGVSPSLGGVTFSNVNQSYSIAQGSGGALTLNAAANVTVDAGAHAIAVPVQMVSNVLVAVQNNADQLTLSGAISGSGGLTKSGSGKLILSGASANSFSGLMAVNEGELDLNKTAGVDAIGASGLAIHNGGTATLLANDQINDAANITNDGGGTFDLNEKSETVASLLNNGSLLLGSGGTLDLVSGFVQNGTATVANASVLNVGQAWVNSGLVKLQGGAVSGSPLSNAGTMDGSGTINAPVYNSGTITATGAGMTFAQTVTNAGLIEATSTMMTFNGNLVISGLYKSDPSTNNYFGDVTVMDSGAMQGGAGDVFSFHRDFFIQSTNSSLFDLSSSTVEFVGDVVHTNSVTGLDLGAVFEGLTATNFAYGTLRLGTNDNVFFVDGDGLSATTNALYVGILDLGGIADNVALLHSSLDIYYNSLLTENGYLNSQTYSLDQGGMLIPLGIEVVIPEPSTAFLLLMALALFIRRFTRSSSRS